MNGYRHLLGWACALAIAPNCWSQIAISTTNDLVFGKLAPGSGGTVTVSTSGSRTRSGGVVLLSSGAGSAASFSISDPDSANFNRVYLITLPANGTVTLASGSNTMAVNDFVSNPSGKSTMTLVAHTLTVGATLSVGANQPAGNYSGSFSVTVNYE